MARPRKASDAQILAATGTVLARAGPYGFTLADVGAEVGVTAAALVQRFGSKRGLLLAFLESALRDFDRRLARARGAGEPPLDVLRATLLENAQGFSTPADVARSLSFLQIDLTDDVFHEAAVRYFETLEGHVRALVEEAVARGQLRPCDATLLARGLVVVYNGSLLMWAMRREGSVKDSLAHDLDAALAPHRVG